MATSKTVIQSQFETESTSQTKWTPAKVDKRCQEINKKEIQNGNGQTKL